MVRSRAFPRTPHADRKRRQLAAQQDLGGIECPAKGDSLTPIQWTGYDQKARQYQGEVLYKDQIHDRFSDKLERCRKNPRAVASTDWDGMRLIWRTIFVAFHGVDHDDILKWAEFEAEY